jgi:arogenate dehydrogenase (NADP+)
MKIGIIGLGLIGGSLGLDWTKKGHQVWGVSRQEQTCQIAEARGVVYQASPDLESLTPAGLDLVVICTPIASILATVERLVGILSSETILTDVASVKAAIVPQAEVIWPYFIGGHPMAGTEKQGIQAAQSHLFRHRPYVLTPTPKTVPEALKCLKSLITDLEASCLEMDPDSHDTVVAWISHLPVMISASLIAACCGQSDPGHLEMSKRLASSGFRDTSRVGGGNPDLGVAMAQYNQQALLTALGHYQDQLLQIRQMIEQEDWLALHSLLEKAHECRPHFVKL